MRVTHLVTAPLHRLQGTIFKQSKAKDMCSMFEIGEATNTAMQRLVTLLVSDIRVSFDWVVLRFAKEEVWTASHN